MVLQRACHDFTGRCRAFVDQNHHRQGFENAFGVVSQAFDRVCAAAAIKLWRGAVGELAVCQLAIGGDDRHVFGQESRGDGYRSIKQTAWIVAQIEHQAFEVVVVAVDFFELARKIFGGALLELAHAEPSIAWLDVFAANGLGADFLARDRHRERAVVFLPAQDREDHFGVPLAAHALDGIVEREAANGGVVNFCDQVIGLQACAKGG